MTLTVFVVRRLKFSSNVRMTEISRHESLTEPVYELKMIAGAVFNESWFTLSKFSILPLSCSRQF